MLKKNKQQKKNQNTKTRKKNRPYMYHPDYD